MEEENCNPSEAEISVVTSKFQAKQNANNCIPSSDIGNLLRDLGLVVQTPVLNDLITKYEPMFIEDNQCNLDTLIDIYIKAYRVQPSEEILYNALKSVCPPGESAVPTHIMRELLMTYGDKLTAEEADEFMTDFDEFGAGVLDPTLVTNNLIHGPK